MRPGRFPRRFHVDGVPACAKTASYASPGPKHAWGVCARAHADHHALRDEGGLESFALPA